MRLISLLFLTFWSAFSAAVVVSDLYHVEVPVSDQATASRSQGMAIALQQVLVKVSGNSAVLNNTVIQQKAVQAERYVKSYRYVRDEIDDSVRLQVIFADNLVDSLLREAGEPIWGESRPLILAWQAVEEQARRSPLNQNSGLWATLIEQALDDRGLPVLWPTLDLTDELVLPLEKLWGLFKQDIDQASRRYDADATLAGRVTPGLEEGWVYRGILLHKQTSIAIEGEGATPESVLRQMADQVAGYLAKQYAVDTDMRPSTQGFEIQVEGIAGFEQYHELLLYLNSKVAINNVSLVGVSGTRLTLMLTLAADWQQVWSVLALDRRLTSRSEAGLFQWEQ